MVPIYVEATIPIEGLNIYPTTIDGVVI